MKKLFRQNVNLPIATSNPQLRKKITFLLDQMPNDERAHSERDEPSYYGASSLIAEKIGMLNRLPTNKACWSHGVIFSQNPDPKMLCYYENCKIYLVYTKIHENILKNKNIPSKAIGAPFLYTKNTNIKRKKGSLLIMPAKAGTCSTHNWDKAQYDLAKYAHEAAKDFDIVAACLSANCIESGYWVDALEKFGIPWFRGASIYEKYSLQKMRIIFDTFETIISNAIGSHIFYAASSGCKVALLDFFAPTNINDASSLPYYQKNPDILKKIIYDKSINSCKFRFPFLFVTPSKAKQHVSWANKFLGLENKISPEEIAYLFGWSYEEIQLERYFKFTFDMAQKGLMSKEKILNDADMALKNVRPGYAQELLNLCKINKKPGL